MDWTTLLSVAAMFIFLWVMMRGCGSMMAGGGCGMGRHSHSGRTDPQRRGHDDDSQAYG